MSQEKKDEEEDEDEERVSLEEALRGYIVTITQLGNVMMTPKKRGGEKNEQKSR
jgi:hypothetical protein